MATWIPESASRSAPATFGLGRTGVLAAIAREPVALAGLAMVAVYAVVALTVGLSLIGIVLWGTLIGSVLPFGLRRLGFDPAASSAPFVATLVDVTGLIIYFSIAYLILRGTLL